MTKVINYRRIILIYVQKGMIDMSVLSVNKDNFNMVETSDKVVLLDFYADWCGPCRMVGPVVDSISQEHPDVFVGKINVDDEQELSMKYGVVSIPTLVVLKDGKEVNRAVGLHSKQEIISMLQV